MSSTKVKKLAFGGNVPRSTPEWYAQQEQARAAERLANPQAHSAAVRAARGAAIQQQAQAMLNRPRLTGLQKAERNAEATAARQAASNARNAARGIRPRPAAAPAAPVPQAAPGPNPKTAEIQEMANNPKLQALTRALSAPKPSTGPSWSQQQNSALKPLPKPMKSGGSVRGGGCAAKGVGKGKMR